MNLEGLQMPSKETRLDEEPKNDKNEPTLRNRQMKTYHLEQQIIKNNPRVYMMPFWKKAR
ncbi:hypothetical protein CR513_30644, partial [Mucuna pruriens]